MNLSNQLKDSGWGATFLAVYTAGILHYFSYDLSNSLFLLASIVPSLLLVYLSITFNDRLMEWFADDVIREAFTDIKDRTDTNEFYWQADGDVQDGIDELDRKAHRRVVAILAGGVISTSLPFLLYYFHGIEGFGAGLGSALVVFYLLSYRPYCSLHEVIKSSAKLYGVDNEN